MGISTRQSSRTSQQQIEALAQELEYPLVALDDVRYLKASDAFANEVLAAIDAGEQIEAPVVRAQQQGTFYLDTPDQVQARFERAGLKDAATMTATIADRCQVELE